jgi:DNA-binding protein H-NS
MATLSELLAQRQELEKQIAHLQGAARSEAISKVRTLMAEHGLTAADIVDKPEGRKSEEAQKRPAPVKYRDQAGNTWSGRGLKPRWLTAALEAGGRLEDFAVS